MGHLVGDNIQLLAAEGTQRPACPFTLHTSCFRLVFATQHEPDATGRPAFWGLGKAAANAVRGRMEKMMDFMLATENCALAVGIVKS